MKLRGLTRFSGRTLSLMFLLVLLQEFVRGRKLRLFSPTEGDVWLEGALSINLLTQLLNAILPSAILHEFLDLAHLSKRSRLVAGSYDSHSASSVQDSLLPSFGELVRLQLLRRLMLYWNWLQFFSL